MQSIASVGLTMIVTLIEDVDLPGARVAHVKTSEVAGIIARGDSPRQALVALAEAMPEPRHSDREHGDA